MWPLLFVATSERGNSGGKTRGPGPHFPWTTSRNPSSVKRVRGSDPEPPPPAAWQPRREWGGPAPSRGTPGAGPTPDAPRRVSRRGSRDMKQSNTGRGGSRHEKGGRGQQSACARRVPGCSTATKRAPRPGWESAGKGDGCRTCPSVSHVSNRPGASLLHVLTFSKGAPKGGPPAPREAPGQRNKMATSASPFHPSPPFPATAVRESPLRDRRPVSPTHKTAAGRERGPGSARPCRLAPSHTV